MSASVWLMSDRCTTLVAGVADCYFAKGLPWLIPGMPREASHSFIHTKPPAQQVVQRMSTAFLDYVQMLKKPPDLPSFEPELDDLDQKKYGQLQ